MSAMRLRAFVASALRVQLVVENDAPRRRQAAAESCAGTACPVPQTDSVPLLSHMPIQRRLARLAK